MIRVYNTKREIQQEGITDYLNYQYIGGQREFLFCCWQEGTGTIVLGNVSCLGNFFIEKL